MNKLTPFQVSRTTKPGMYSDGGGLYLQVSGATAKSWLYRYKLNGRERYLGLGGLNAIPLSRARALAAEARRLRAEGRDPIENRRAQRAAAKVEAARAVTFEQCAERFVSAHEASWSHARHRQQWTNSLATYVHPLIGALPVAAVDTALVLKAIEPIWTSMPTTAGRVRQRIEAVLDFARAREYRSGENPARWRGHLDHLLPQRDRFHTVKHHPALPFAELPTFMADLRNQDSISARALEVLILCASRTKEIIGACWGEFDLAASVWTIPAARMKNRKEHRVPLTPRVLDILRKLRDEIPRDSNFVFAGGKSGRPLSAAALQNLLKVMQRPGITIHGFRSTFRDWASETTNFQSEVAEAALAHAIPTKVEAAYRRGDLFEKRRRLMNAWSEFASKPRTAAMVPMRRRHAS